MPKKETSYQFTLRVFDEDIKTWMDSQKNKNKSITLILKRAINEFGYEDINELLTNAFLKNDPRFEYKTTQPNTPPIKNETIEVEQVEVKQPTNPQPEQPQAKEQKKETPKPTNFGFLSH